MHNQLDFLKLVFRLFNVYCAKYYVENKGVCNMGVFIDMNRISSVIVEFGAQPVIYN